MSTDNKSFSQDNKHAWRNPWVIGWLGLVAVVLGVNAVMISLAVITNPGLVTEDYYEKGRTFERNMINQMVARNALEWQVRLDMPKTPLAGQNEHYRFIVTDKRGVPMESLKVRLQGYRPSDANADFFADMEPLGNGIYQAKLNFPLKGLWELNINVQHGEQQYDMVHQRLEVQG